MEDEEDFCFYGTPIEDEQETARGARRKDVKDQATTRALPIWKQVPWQGGAGRSRAGQERAGAGLQGLELSARCRACVRGETALCKPSRGPSCGPPHHHTLCAAGGHGRAGPAALPRRLHRRLLGGVLQHSACGGWTVAGPPAFSYEEPCRPPCLSSARMGAAGAAASSPAPSFHAHPAPAHSPCALASRSAPPARSPGGQRRGLGPLLLQIQPQVTRRALHCLPLPCSLPCRRRRQRLAPTLESGPVSAHICSTAGAGRLAMCRPASRPLRACPHPASCCPAACPTAHPQPALVWGEGPERGAVSR